MKQQKATHTIETLIFQKVSTYDSDTYQYYTLEFFEHNLWHRLGWPNMTIPTLFSPLFSENAFMIVLINVSDFNPDDFTLTVRTRNGTELSIYRYMKPRSPSSRKAVSQIIIDSSHMPSSLVNEVIILGESQRNILTLCEVSVYGRLNSFGWFRQKYPLFNYLWSFTFSTSF